ncbi:glutathione S-transferase [Altererythrobacter sp. CAU 1778]
MAEPVLYSFRRCPYAMRARMALHIAGIQPEHREVLLREKPAAMLEASPKGTVPVLVLGDSAVLDESIDIMRWALGRNDPKGWLAREDTGLIASNDGAFKHHLDRYKYASRHDSDPAEHRDAALGILRGYETRLEASANLCGEQRGMTDAAIMPFVRQFAHTDRAWFDAQPLPFLQAWLERWKSSPLFAAVMAKHPVWQA